MQHRSFIRRVPGSDTAVVLIHGIAGTPAHFRNLLPVIPEDCSVFNLLLDGHGGSVLDFGRSSMEKWRTQASSQIEELTAQYAHVVLIAHSMGTLFAIRAALKYPDKIPFLFLLAVPTRPWVRFSTMLTALRVAGGNICPEDFRAIAMQNATSIAITWRLWQYITWIPRLLELLGQIRRTRALLPRLNTPCFTFQSLVDELVSFRSCKDLEPIPCIRNTVLTGSGHFQYGAEDTRLLQSRLAALFAQLRRDGSICL